jgi:hypothetical protein
VSEVLARHEKMLQEYCLRTFGEPVPQSSIYREVVSGETIADRPMMIKLLEDIEKGDIDFVVVVEPQRLSRGSFGDIDKIVNSFKYTDTKIATLTKTYDLNNKFDRKYFEQELLRGNDYLEYVKEILTRGRIRSVEDGLYIASKPPFGYDKLKLKKGYTIVPNADAETVRYIFEIFNEGLGTTEVAKHLIKLGIKSQTGKPWTPHMVRNILTSDLYVGVLTYGRRETKKTMKDGIVVESRPWNKDNYIKSQGIHEHLIPQEVFDKAQELLKARAGKTVRSDRTIKNPLAGIVKCRFCGCNMARGPYDKRPVPTLICRTIGCKNVSSDLDLVEKRVIELLEKELENYKFYVENYEEEIKSSTATLEKSIKKIDKELASLKADLQNALIKYNRGKVNEEEYIFLRNYTLEEENRLQEQKKAILEKMQDEELEQKRTAIPLLETCIKNYYDLSITDRHKTLTAIIDKIIYEKTKGGRWNEEDRSSFTLELFLKI